MEPILIRSSSLLAVLWLAAAPALAAEARIAGRLLVDLDAADFNLGSDHWPQHTVGTGIPGHFMPRGSPTRQTVAGAPAVVFDGDGDCFVGPITTFALHGAGATHSVEAWAFQGNVRDQESLVSWGKRWGPDASFAGFRYGAHPEFGAVARWRSSEMGFAVVPPPGQWHHLAYTYDGNRQSVFVDGKLDGTKEVGTLDAQDTLPILLGAELGGDQRLEGKFTHFSGALGQVRIHSGVLAPEAVAANFQMESPRYPGPAAKPLVRPPQHRFSFNAAAGPAPDGTTVQDTIGGLAVVVRGANARFMGSGVQLPGGSSATEAYLDFPNRLVSSQESVSIEFWETQLEARDWCRILSIGTNRGGEIKGPGGTFTGGEALTLFGNVGTAPVNRFARSEGTLLNGGPDRDPSDYPDSELGTEFHQAIVYEKALREWRWYRNGVLMEVIPDAQGPTTLDDVNVWLGRSEFSADNNFCGIFHEVRIYNRTLEEAEIVGNTEAGPGKLNLAEAAPALSWTPGGGGLHSFANTDRSDQWGTGPGGPHPDGAGATATFASNLAGDQTIELDSAITLGSLNLGARNSGGGFLLVPGKAGTLTLDAGRTAPASITQLPHSPSNTLKVPLTFASDADIANLSEKPLVLAGPLHGRGVLCKTGPGPVVVTGDGSGFDGPVRVVAGDLVLGDAGHFGMLASRRMTVTDPGRLVVDRADDLEMAPTLDGNGGFLHQGRGRLRLAAGAVLAISGIVEAKDGAGPLVSEGLIEGARSLRTDTEVVLSGHSTTKLGDSLWVGQENGGCLTLRDSASLEATSGSGAVLIGTEGHGQSVLAVEGGSLAFKELCLGRQAGPSGVLLQSGGNLTNLAGGEDSRLGGANEGSHQAWGAWRMTGGSFTSEKNLQIGAFGTGLLEVEGGSFMVKGFLGLGHSTGPDGTPSHGLVDVRSGRLLTTSPDRLLLVGEEGVGVLNIRGKGEVRCANAVIIGAGSLAKPGTGTLNLLSGGTLLASGIGQFNQSKASGHLYLDGGTLLAGASNARFLDGLDGAWIGPGGLRLDTNGFEVTITQPLLAPVGQGIASLPVVAGGSGYLAPPWIEIAGGGATAMAVLTGGAVTSIVLTNPGDGYTAPPATSLLGGGNGSGLVLGTPVLAPNKSGGLTKAGRGSLSLRGRCTYQGPTTVESGSLLVEGDLGSASGDVEVRQDAVLGGSGTVGGNIRTAAGSTLAPGSPLGTLTASADVRVRGTLAISIAATHASQIEVTGELDLAQAKLEIRSGGVDVVSTAHIVARYGSLRGQFAETALPPGFTLDYHYGGMNQIALIPATDPDGE